MLNRDIEFIAHIAPQSTQHLIIEGTLLIVLHQLGSLLQSFGSHLVRLLATHLHHISILNGTLTEDNKQRDEQQTQHHQGNQIGSRGEEIIALSILLAIT